MSGGVYSQEFQEPGQREADESVEGNLGVLDRPVVVNRIKVFRDGFAAVIWSSGAARFGNRKKKK